MAPCGQPSAPPKSFVTNLITGKGISSAPMDQSKDSVPPCGGGLPPIDAVGAIPLQWSIPQLVKIKSDRGDCSGALISVEPQFGARAVITAAHCVYENGQFFKNVRVMPGYKNGENPQFGMLRATEVLTFTRFTSDRQNAHDIAVIKLDGLIVDLSYNPYGIAPFRTSCTNIRRLIFRPHYNPSIGGLQIPAFAGGYIGACYDGTLVSGVPTGAGSSGSPVVDQFSRAIFAVHSSGTSSHSFEAPLTEAKICAIIDFLQETTGICKIE